MLYYIIGAPTKPAPEIECVQECSAPTWSSRCCFTACNFQVGKS